MTMELALAKARSGSKADNTYSVALSIDRYTANHKATLTYEALRL